MLRRIISGGQTGADRGALEAAISRGFPHGGWCPKGRRAEDGVIPSHFTLQETGSANYRTRTELNVQESDATVIFAQSLGPGSRLTTTFCRRYKKPYIVVDISLSHGDIVILLVEFISQHKVQVLNVAGSRESKHPGIQEKVRQVMKNLL